MIKRILKSAVDSLGYSIERKPRKRLVPSAEEVPPDFTPQEQAAWRSVQRYTMTSKERLVSLIRAVQYLERNQIPGAFVEYGVWRGWQCRWLIAKTLLSMPELVIADLFCSILIAEIPDAARRCAL